MASTVQMSARMWATIPTGIVGPIQANQALAAAIETGPMVVQIATGTTNQAVRIIGTQGITTATGMFITSDQNISVSYNGGTAIPLTANGFQAMGATSITAMSLTNNSGLTANVTIWLVGS